MLIINVNYNLNLWKYDYITIIDIKKKDIKSNKLNN